MSMLSQMMQMMAAESAVGPADPYWSSVIAMLPLTGPAGGTSFSDATGRVWTPNGGITTVTTQSKFGGGSAQFSGAQFLSTPSSADLSMLTGDFTIEAWLYYPSANSGVEQIFNVAQNYGVSAGLNDGKLFCGPNSIAYGPTSSIVVALNRWVHLASCRASGTMRIFYDGVVKASGSDSYNYGVGVGLIGAGSNNNGVGVGGYLHAYMNYLRVTKGVARYTANFTPPTEPFPTHG